MFKNLNLGIKQGIGFGIIIILAAVIGITGSVSIKKINSSVITSDNQNRLIKYVLQLRQHEKNFILRNDHQYAEKVFKIIDKWTVQKVPLKKTRGFPK
ncbi:MAG: hypothetical protein U9N77_10940 [Thermodesulfobacteriota bacterium]|nr:hypothetical protein [Thermodesulfobacteriota bacterium]